MIVLAAFIGCCAWGCFTAAMGHPVFASPANFALTVLPSIGFSTAGALLQIAATGGLR
jgi:hypothetical protein